jgi:hypothetical protein
MSEVKEKRLFDLLNQKQVNCLAILLFSACNKIFSDYCGVMPTDKMKDLVRQTVYMYSMFIDDMSIKEREELEQFVIECVTAKDGTVIIDYDRVMGYFETH